MNHLWETDDEKRARKNRSPWNYLATPPIIIRFTVCFPRASEVIGGKTFTVMAFCTYPGRCRCGFQLEGHDPGDEDPNP